MTFKALDAYSHRTLHDSKFTIKRYKMMLNTLKKEKYNTQKILTKIFEKDL